MIRYAPLFGFCMYCLFGAFLLFQMASAPTFPVRLTQYGEGFLQPDPESGKFVIRQTTRNAIVNVNTSSIANLIYSKGIKVVSDHPESRTLIRILTGRPTVFAGKLTGSGGSLPDVEAEGKVFFINPNGVVVTSSAFFNLGGQQHASTLDPKLCEFLAVSAAGVFAGSPAYPLPDNYPKASDAVELVAKGNVYALAIRKRGYIRASRATVDTPKVGFETQDKGVPPVTTDDGK